MCVEIWTIFRDPNCHHRIYQNTFPCHVARRCSGGDDLILEKSKFLPDKQTKIPPGFLQCRRKIATKPKDTRCPECAKEEHRVKAGGSEGTASADLSSSVSSVQRITSPSPDGKASEKIRHSLMLLERQRGPSLTITGAPASDGPDTGDGSS
ncbi:hypothetical protein AAE478_006032 [Parahypoxylon ruwenzoriense]